MNLLAKMEVHVFRYFTRDIHDDGTESVGLSTVSLFF